MKSTRTNINEKIFCIDNFFTPEECTAFIDLATKDGFKQSSPSGGGHGRTRREDARTNKYTVVADLNQVDLWWKKLRPFVPDNLSFIPSSPYFGTNGGSEWKPVGLVERIRFYRYDQGEEYPEHMDGSYSRRVERDGHTFQQQSFLTFLAYLNDDFEGGTTNFFMQKQHCRFLRDIENKMPTVIVKPQTGTALISCHAILHEGSQVTAGTKFVLRTDIVYERPIPNNQKIQKFKNCNVAKNTVGEWQKIFEPSCKIYHD
ncbi:hypothetical protein AKO1_008112 [Acrasis kona]|uniref:Fe2OG dioxygenase domain-containing protein n=1 Tax=Acrasis kona TaxID=1008807 RepID=A0AAW2YPN9_9EUKA